MNTTAGLYVLGIGGAGILLRALQVRLRLSRAKHPSLRGHARLSRRVARLVPFYSFDERGFFTSDDAPESIAASRRSGFERLAAYFSSHASRCAREGAKLEEGISDALFTSTYRVPFQYRDHVRKKLRVASIVEESCGTMIKDVDGEWFQDLTGSYGVNVFGNDFYKECIDDGVARARKLGPVLGPYHPLIAENVGWLKQISGLDEVSFHMSGTEAVMQAVRLARFHRKRPRLVVFCGAYHGWWDGVQPGLGSQRRADDVYVLKEMSNDTLKVLRTRRDIACVLVNPLQALHPNASAPGDASLVDSGRAASFDRTQYSQWLRELRRICSERRIVLIFDEVFMGFRLAYGGAQEYFDVRADMVTYGKTLGGGLPVGVVCGTAALMKRFREERPVDVCFARGTFNSHPYVMAAMNEFLRRIQQPHIRKSYLEAGELWNARAAELNRRLEAKDLPVRVANMVSIWTVLYQRPSRYNWMFQYYLRAQGLLLSWVGSGRLIFSHNYTERDFEAVAVRFVAAAESMLADGWWWADDRLSNRAIRRRILREMIAQYLPFKRRDQSARNTADVTPAATSRGRMPDSTHPVPSTVETEA